MTRPTILDLDLVVVPREAEQVMLDEVTAADQHEPFSDKTMSGIFEAMLSASPYPTAWDDVRKYVDGLEEEIGRLEDENSELRYEPWPEWARAVLKVIRSHTGYDGYDDAVEGVDMPLELSEHLSQVESDTDRWKARAEAAEARIAELEKRLADAERVIEPFAERAGKLDGIWKDHETQWSPEYGNTAITIGHLRAARAYMEGK